MSNQLTVNAGNILDELRGDLAPLLAESGQSFDRLRTVFMTAVQQNPNILKCDETSIRREIRKCAADGLVPDNKEATMIPYQGELQYQPMVLGIIKRMRELGDVFRIDCKLVHESDVLLLDEADPNSISHKSNPFAKAEDRGPVVGGYVAFRDKENRVMHLETMSLEDFQQVRNASKAPNSPAWTKWTNEMYRKAVLRRGSKYISINNDKIRALLERQDDMFDFRESRSTERFDPFTGEVLTNSSAPAIEHKPQVNMSANTQERHQEPRQQQNRTSDDQRGGKQQQRASAAKPGKNQQAAKKEEAKQVEQQNETKEAAKIPEVPDVSINPDDRKQLIESAQKVLRIGLELEIAPNERRKILKSAAVDHKEHNPEYLHPLIKAMIDATDWAIKTDDAGKPWAADHAMFVHKVRSLLDVEKLDIGKYP